MKPLVLGLGNELLSDDGVGILTVRRLSEEWPDRADYVESALHGIALIDTLAGYEKAIVVDAIHTGAAKPGTIIELVLGDLRAVYSPSPHYAGLPEMIRLAQELGIDFPDDIRIIAVEIVDPLTLGGGLSPAVASAMEELGRRIKHRLDRWQKEIPAGRKADSVLTWPQTRSGRNKADGETSCMN
jgi:hydrogenase maturation protease